MLKIPHSLEQEIFDYLNACLPEEGCGLIAGRLDTAVKVIPVENTLHSPVKYLMKPEEQLEAFLKIEHEGLDLIGIYHSHPDGPDFPSETDLKEYYYPEAVMVICTREGLAWRMSAFWIEGKHAENVTIALFQG